MRKLLVLGAAALVSASAFAHSQERTVGGQEPVTFTVTGTFSDGTTRDITELVFQVVADRDSDNDGRPDESVMTISCAAGRPATATFTIRARDAGSGMATGRRRYQPVPIRRTQSDGPQAPQTFRGSWDLATAKGARSAGAAADARAVTFGPEFSGCR